MGLQTSFERRKITCYVDAKFCAKFRIISRPHALDLSNEHAFGNADDIRSSASPGARPSGTFAG